MIQKTAMTKDVRAFLHATDALLNRPAGIEGMGILGGYPGLGKTTSVALVANIYDGVFVRALSSWTPTSMLGALCQELGGKRMCRCTDMVGFIIDKLSDGRPRPILIDEADYLFKKKDIEMVESLRDIYDLSKCPVILIGMEDIARCVSTNPIVSRRITQWVEYKGLDQEDTQLVAKECCEVEIADDLLSYVHQETTGNIGRVIIAYERIEKFAKSNGLKTITRADWNDQPLYFDQPTFAGKALRR